MTNQKDKSMTAGEKVGLGVVIAGAVSLIGLAVGTKTGRQVCGGILDASAAADQLARKAQQSQEEYRISLQKQVLDKKLELCRLNAQGFWVNWRVCQQLENEIRILNQEVERM